MDYRIEHDSMGQVKVPASALWGAQTQRSIGNFPIGRPEEIMPIRIIRAFATLKRACARANLALNPRMTSEKAALITRVCDEILTGALDEHFPLVVWQTGSGTQTNMNVNEVIANRARILDPSTPLHPNDDVNMGQSSNDTFPTALHMAAAIALVREVLPAIDRLCASFSSLEKRSAGIIKSGRTHLMDATPIAFSQEVSGWRASLERDREMIVSSLSPLCALAIGGTAVGTGLNAPAGFDSTVCNLISEAEDIVFTPASNKFHALTSHDEVVFAHGALKALAGDLMKIANDIRLMGSGPRTGLGELELPANEPGSSIMPGKVNPTQCEALTMVAVQVMGNDTAIGIASSQGNFELNVYLPVMAYNFLQSARLLSQAMLSFADHCADGIRPVADRMRQNLNSSLMLVTALSPVIGYEKSAVVAQTALKDGITLREACLKLGYLDAETFDRTVRPEKMI